MKDIEKIQSPDLACQVADANPGNFGIEQEVAAMVGATVPAPTAPSADDARELGAQLLVFLRRALQPIRSALRTALAAIYDYLDSRCTAYTPAAYASYIPRPYDPMGTPPTPRTLPNLLTAITAFSDRKIGGVPEAEDGISLVQLISTQYSTITELRDSTKGWTLSNGKIFDTFPNLQKLTMGCRTIQGINKSIANLTELEFTDAETLVLNNNVFYNVDMEEFVCPIKRVERGSNSYCYFISGTPNLKRVKLPELEGGPIGTNGSGFINGDGIEEIDMSKAGDLQNYLQDGLGALPNIKIFRLGKITRWVGFAMWRGSYDSEHFWSVPANLIHYEIGAGTDVSINLSGWSPTNALDASRTDLIEQGSTAENNLQQFLQNFLEHILSRLSTTGGNYTLTLSQAVRDAIHDGGLDQYKPSNWTITPNPTNT